MPDLRFALRQLLKNPGFTVVAVLTLALGIGANTAIFSLIDAILLKLLPVKNPGELLAFNHAGGDRSGNGFPYPVYERLAARNRAFSDVFAFSTWPEAILTVRGVDQPLAGGALLVSGNYYAGLGVQPWLGRLLSPADNQIMSGHPVAVLSYGFWQSQFGGDRSIIGQTMALNGTPFTIIGVTPPEFFGLRVGRVDAITIPILMQPQLMSGSPFWQDVRNWDVEVMGRLRRDQTEAQAKAGLRVLFPEIEREMVGGSLTPERLKIIQDRRIELTPASQGLSALRRQFSEPLRILMGVVALVLLIACANVANLLLSRAAARQKEFAVRLAIGASRTRLIRQLLIESLLLAGLGGGAGLLFAAWIGRLCVALIPDRTGSIELNLALDARVLTFTAAASLFTGLIFGLAPAWQATTVTLASSLKEGARDHTHRPRRWWMGRGLVGAQVALSVILLMAAGLFVRTFQKLKTQNPGFASENLLLFSLDGRMRRSIPDPGLDLFTQLLDRINHLPGVVSATLSRDGNFGGGGRTRTDLDLEGSGAQNQAARDVFDVPVGPRFLETLGIPLRQGREITLQDDAHAPKVAVINQAAAHYFFGHENPIGRRIGVGAPGDTIIIGVSQDTKLNDLRESPPRVMYRSFLQTGPAKRMTFALRTAVPPASMLSTLRRELEAYEPNLPVFGFTTLQEIVERSLASERLFASLSGLFGALALILASVGIYGVMAYSVAQRTRELGLRIALGARRGGLLALIIGQGMKVVITGLAVGTLAAFGLTRIIASKLYGISATDPVVIGIVLTLLLMVALAACYLPARRATRVDPMEALRSE